MSSRLTLSVASATFLAALGALWLLRSVRDEVAEQGRRIAKLESSAKYPSRVPDPALRSTDGEADDGTVEPRPAAGKTTLDQVGTAIGEIDDAIYELSTQTYQEFYDIKRALNLLRGQITRLQNQVAAGGAGLPSALPPRGSPLGQEDIVRLAKAAAEKGVKVEDGVVTVRGFLNIAPNQKMPIEYFVTRYPEAGHETMVHVLGEKTLDEIEERPHEAAAGVGLALYQGLLAAGFREGESFRPDPESPRESPTWLLPDGDIVYLYVRYEWEGETRVVPATSWILDPETGTHLPLDAFRFTGSLRTEDPNSGEETVAAELGGLLVSVWPNRHALVEVALLSAVRNNYAYNADAMPQVAGRKDPLYLDLIFSKKPLAPTDPKSAGDAPADAPPSGER